MADEDDRLACRVDGPLGHGNVVGERQRRILDDTDFVAVLLQVLVDALPTGAVHETAVDEDDSGSIGLAHGAPFFEAFGSLRD